MRFTRRARGFTAAVLRIASRRAWPDNWLNDAVTGFASHFDTDDDWDVFDAGDGVVVLIARPSLLLAMKLLAGRGTRDRDAIERLLSACHVVTIATAEEIFDRYYPTEVMNHRARSVLAGVSDVADS